MALESLTPDRYGLCTLYAGAAVDEQQLQQMAEHLRQRFSNLEIEVQRGEQEHYPYILSIE